MSPPDMHERREFDGDSRSVAAARRFVTDALTRWHTPLGDTALMVSELATNAVLHAGSPFVIDIYCSDAGGLRVEVSDTDPTPPVPELGLANESVRGRGLLLVTALARQWGYHVTSHGKSVWFEV